MDVPGYCVITGAASGIGRASAKKFMYEGSAGVALLDKDSKSLEATKQEIIASAAKTGHGSCKILAYEIDVTDENQVDTTIKAVHEEFGRIDYVVNCAGIAMRHKGGVAYAKLSDWQRVIDINLSGTFLVLRAAAQIMLDQEPIRSAIDGRSLQRGSVVNIASILGTVATPAAAGYVASKHGVIGLTKSASEDYAGKGIRINAICPGFIDTAVARGDEDIASPGRERAGAWTPMGRRGRPSEVADAICFLAGGRSSFMTGSSMLVDGGYTQH